jgi:hypothetical protein
VLQRYYMLTFTYNIRKFGNGQGQPQGSEDGGRERRRGDWSPGSGGSRPEGGGFDGGHRGF